MPHGRRKPLISGVRRGEDGVREAWPAACGQLLAAAVTKLEAYYLLEPGAVGSGEWLRKWDARLEAVMRADDGEGYFKQVLCGDSVRLYSISQAAVARVILIFFHLSVFTPVSAARSAPVSGSGAGQASDPD